MERKLIRVFLCSETFCSNALDFSAPCRSDRELLKCPPWVTTSRKTAFPSLCVCCQSGCDGPEAAAAAAGCGDDTTLLNGTLCFLEAAAGLRDVVSGRRRRIA